MNKSNIGNTSIAVATQSRLKTLTDIEDKSITNFQPNFRTDKVIFDQSIHIEKWLKRKQKISKTYISQIQSDETKSNSFYMINIEEIADIIYRRKVNKEKGPNQHSNEGSYKIYVKIYANLFNASSCDFMRRTVQSSIYELQGKTASQFKLSDLGYCLFLYSKFQSEDLFRIRLEICILESKLIESSQVMQSQQHIGYCDIDPYKGLKSRQRAYIFSPRISGNIQTVVTYSVFVSDSLKILQKLIPPNCLCTTQQSISGLAGRKLPNNIASLHYPLEYTQLYSAKIDIVCIDIGESAFNMKIKQVQHSMKMLQNIENPHVTIKDVKLEGYFHNGWVKFSQSSIKIEDKMSIQKRNSKKNSNQIIKIKHYTSQQLFTMPYIFLDEEAILLFQVVAKVEIRSNQSSTQMRNADLPVCYSYFVINKMSNDQKQVKKLYMGQGVAQSRQKFISPKQQIQGSKIQFYLNIDHSNKIHLSKHQATLHSNKSNTDLDRIALEKQRMIRQNRKLRYQNRLKKIQLNQEIPILDTTNFKQNLYKNEIQKLKKQRKEKQEILQYLKKKLNQISPSIRQDIDLSSNQSYDERQRIFQNKVNEKNYFNSQFYKLVIEREREDKNFSGEDYNPIKLDFLSLFRSVSSWRNFQSGEIPLDIMRTQYIQKSFAYGIFINWLNLTPISQDKKIPRKFYFQTSFFDKYNIKSCRCGVHEASGEILIIEQQQTVDQTKQKNDQNKVKETKVKFTEQEKQKKDIEKKTKKIFYVEIGPKNGSKNNNTNFINFICYLYHSQIQIKIMDAFSKTEFGHCFLDLKQLIRMRRNQASIIRDLLILKEGQVKAKLKMQLKSIKKQSNYFEQPKIKTQGLQLLTMQPQARQIQRITTFKKSKLSGPNNTLSKIDRIINQELTKQQIKINIFRMKGQFIKIEVTNRKNNVQNYQVIINDPDRFYLKNEELVVVNSPLFDNLSKTGWWNFLENIDKIIGNFILVNQNNCFQLSPGQTGAILFFYYSERKYEGTFERDKNKKVYETEEKNNQLHKDYQDKDLLRIYNHKRCIDVSLKNPFTSTLQSLYKVNIQPMPDTSIYQYSFVRKKNSKVMIQVPYLPSQEYVVYIDDPTVITHLNQKQQIVALDCFVGNEGQCRKFNVSILSPYPQNRLLMGYHFQLWGAQQIVFQGKIWQSKDILIDTHSSIFLKQGIQYFNVVTEDEGAVTLRDKNPIKINQKQGKTITRFTITPYRVQTSFYEIKFLHPTNFEMLYRYILRIKTQDIQISQKITLRIKLTDKLLEQPFGFKNEQSKKVGYKIRSSHPYILWSAQETFEVQGKGQKKIKISINAQQVTHNQSVLLGFIGQKLKFYYLFFLELDNKL